MANKPSKSQFEIFMQTFLPSGVSVEQFYIALTVLVMLVSAISIYKFSGANKRKLTSRINNIKQRHKEMHSGLYKPKQRKKPQASINLMRRISGKLQLVKKFQLERAELTLVQAGFRSRDAIAIFAFLNLISPIILFPLGLGIMLSNHPVSIAGKIINYIWPVLGLYMGMKLPWYLLNRARKKRYLMLQRALSDSLDLLTVCAEAGLSISAAIDRVSRELGVAYPEMAEELSMTSLEIGFYPEKNKALNNLVQRCDLKEIRGIATVLIQTEKYGTPIAQALRVLSTEFRQQRMLRAENKAARLPALMTLPMILFILPTVFIIIMAPAVINTKKSFAPVAAQTTGKELPK